MDDRSIQNIQKHYRGAVKEWEKLRAEQKILRGKRIEN